MNFIRSLRNNRAQAIAEYVGIFTVILAAIAAISFGDKVQQTFRDYADRQIEKITTGNTSGGGGGGGGGGGCFLKGTNITLADGSVKSIDEIKAGDMVLGYDGKGVQPGKVTKTFYHPKLQGYLLITTEDNRQIKVTGSHLIFRGKDYKATRLLKPDATIFLLEDNKLKPIRVKSVEIKNEVIDLYNLEIAKLHNFFAEGALCHNLKDEGDEEDY